MKSTRRTHQNPGILHVALLAASVCALATGCSFQQYNPQPLNPAAIKEKLAQKDPAGEAFHKYLLNNGYTSFPLQNWGLNELTYCALFFHPSLDVAREQWRTAELSQAGAGARPAPSINGHIARSNQANEDISAYALGFSIDIPIETSSKRDIRIESARHLSQAAKLEIAQTAWELRNQIAQSLYEYQHNLQMVKLLLGEQKLRQDIVNLYQKRVSLGAASNVELSTAQLQLQTITAELASQQKNRFNILAKLAGNLGLPLSKVDSLTLAADSSEAKLNPMPTDEAQTTALLNRLDIRVALEKYAAAEAKLKLEIAKQYPDIVLSPGYAYEFGDKIWSLGFSSLINFLHKNKVAIAEATQLRELEATQFEALQARVITEANIANAAITQATQALQHQQTLLVQQQRNTQRMERKLQAGEIDRLELAYSKLENTMAEKNVIAAKFQLNTAINQLENALQKPLTRNKNQADIEQLSSTN